MTQERVLCIPMDYRIPKIRIKTKQVNEIINLRIVVRIDTWDINSNYPDGHYVKQLGEIGKIDTEIQALLVENSISISPFSSNMLNDLPLPSLFIDKKWSLPEEESIKRRDLRNERVFSIDPKGSQDIDDALHVKILPKGRIQLGVHIADVAYFVKRDSLLDIEAKSRGTTVYLANTKYDMLPTILSEYACSLRENVDRPAVSVIWELNSKFEVISTWFGRTSIRSRYELNYELAQKIIDNTCDKEEMKQLLEFNELRKDLIKLVEVGRKLRENRLNRGALELESSEIRFELNVNKDPINIIPKKDQEINHIVAEYMIFANQFVAEKIYSIYPTASLLRRHPFPRTNRFEELIKLAASKGFVIDTSSNKALSHSLSAAILPDSSFNQLLKTLTTQIMEEAEYISSGSYDVDQFYHYGLATDFYTHFTSPIRRYADVVVHRQLLDAIENIPEPYLNNLQLSELCQHLNEKHRSSKQAQRDSVELFQALYFKNKNEIEDSVIYDVKNNGFLVFLPKYKMKGIVYLRDSNGKINIPKNSLSLSPTTYESDIIISDFTVDEQKQQILLQTNRGTIMIGLFDHITIKIIVQESRLHR